MKKEKEVLYWARALFLVLEEGEKDEEKVIKNLILALGKKNYLIPAIIKKYKRIKQKEGKVDVFIAEEISEELKAKINRKVEEREGKNKIIDYTIDKDLIGGFQIKTKDYVVKASIKDALTKIKNRAYGYN